MTKLFHKLELSDKEENISPERKKKAAIAAGASALFAGAGYIVQKEYLRGALYFRTSGTSGRQESNLLSWI